MAAGRCIITYGRDGRRIEAACGTRLLDAILPAAPDHRHICGGRGFCTSCRIVVAPAGAVSPPTAHEIERLGSRCGELRLACQCRLLADVAVEPATFASLIDW